MNQERLDRWFQYIDKNYDGENEYKNSLVDEVKKRISEEYNPIIYAIIGIITYPRHEYYSSKREQAFSSFRSYVSFLRGNYLRVFEDYLLYTETKQDL